MTDDMDPYVEDDAAYVMGALSPQEREAFETHLAECPRCSQSVAELSSMTGLLAQVPLGRVVQPENGQEPAPDLLLPGLMRAARSERRRRSLRLMASGAVAAAVVAIAVVIGVSLGGPAKPAGTTVAMSPVRSTAVTGTLHLTEASWGTQVSLDCQWVGSAAADWDDKKTYQLVAVPTNGTQPRLLAQWALVPGEDATVVGSTDLATDRIARIELQESADKTVLLEADPQPDVTS
jgi:hypothetical protein